MTPSQLLKYGLTVEDFEALLLAQRKACPLCRRKFTARTPPVIDHDHKYGAVRGLLCKWCNTLLGLLRDDSTWMASGNKYLLHPPANHVFMSPRLHVSAPPGADS